MPANIPSWYLAVAAGVFVIIVVAILRRYAVSITFRDWLRLELTPDAQKRAEQDAIARRPIDPTNAGQSGRSGGTDRPERS
jgi:hypothetical protein